MYSVITAIISLFLAPLFMLHPRGRRRLAERFGSGVIPAGRYLWIHAASLGEMRGALPLIPALKVKYPGTKILCTATSPTAFSGLENLVDELRLIPFDSKLWLKRGFDRIEIERVLICETELWPALLSYLRDRKVRLDIVNARISDFSWPRYSALRAFIKPLLIGVESIAAIDTVSAERFVKLGVERGRVVVCGNSKYDFIPKVGEQNGTGRSKFVAGAEPVLVLGSIRPGEEQIWFPALKAAVLSKRLQLVVAPRHQEKFRFFEDQIVNFGVDFVRRSSGAIAQPGQVLILDTLGELESVYSFSDLAFIGGTIQNFGGHNMLEAAAYGVALALGPHRANIREVAAELELNGGIFSVTNLKDAEAVVMKVAERDISIKQKGVLAREFWMRNRGATERILNLLARDPR